nr:unnamed protein product [Callosobruchus analis]
MARITGLTKHQIGHRRSSDIYKEYLHLAKQHRQPPAIAESPTREEQANPRQASPPRIEAPALNQRVPPSKTMFSPKKVMSSIRRILRAKGTEGTLATDTVCALQQHSPTSVASCSKPPCPSPAPAQAAQSTTVDSTAATSASQLAASKPPQPPGSLQLQEPYTARRHRVHRVVL